MYRLEHGLKEPFKSWYRLHSILMENKLPEWIHEGKPSERLHFLRLPDKLKKMYMNYFWVIRQNGTDELFESRLVFANMTCREGGRDGWDTDRGHALLLCGRPISILYFVNGEWSSGGVDINMPTIGDECFQKWFYHQRGVGMAYYVFKWHPPGRWRRAPENLRDLSGMLRLEEYWRKQFAPTKVGWATWGSVLAEYLNIFKK